MKQSDITNGIVEYTLDSWKEFFALTPDLFAIAPAFIYRGQSNYDWSLVSSLDRHELQFPKRKNLSTGNPPYFNRPPLMEEEHLAAFRRTIRGRRGANPLPLTEDECWALGQHHGLMTPLLDFTRSPYFALFFAFEESEILIDGKLTEPEFRGVYALSTATIDSPKHAPPEMLRVVSSESDENFRSISQAALFLKIPRHSDVQTYISKCFEGDTHSGHFIKIKIPSSERHDCLVALNKMNINHMTLFPDIDGAAKHVNSLWQPGHEDLIIHF